MESLLGHQLFYRTSRSVLLTEEGQHFLTAARRVLQATEEAESTGSTIASGLLRIRSVPVFARYQLAPIMPEFIRRHPKVQVEFTLTTDRTAWLGDGGDIAVTIGSLPSSSLVAHRLAMTRWVICASPDYLKRRGRPKTLKELDRHQRLDFSMSTDWHYWDWSEVEPLGHPRRPASFVANQGDMLLALALAGAGIVRLAEYHISEHLRSGRLVALFPERLGVTEEPIHVLYRRVQKLNPRVSTFLDFLQESFSTPPWIADRRHWLDRTAAKKMG